jgi:RNA polymerase sigma factor (sigma-70 family)
MPESPTTQPSLLVRLRNDRDEQAWTQFVDLYAPLLYDYARRHGLQDADAADLMQIVLRVIVSAIRRLDYDPQRGSFRGWLFTIVRSQLFNFRRRKHEFCRGTGDSSTQRLLEEQPAPQEEASAWDAEYEQRLFAWAVQQVRPQVRETTWQAFWQTSVEGKSGKEVAAALGLSVAAVHLAKSRVMVRLRAVLQQTRESET